jgi:hypothetical protein
MKRFVLDGSGREINYKDEFMGKKGSPKVAHTRKNA